MMSPIELHELQSELTGLVGAYARLSDYTSSHDRLTVQLSAGNVRKRLEIMLCSRISAPIVWKLTNPIVTERTQDIIVLSDQDVEIVCEHISLWDGHW